MKILYIIPIFLALWKSLEILVNMGPVMGPALLLFSIVGFSLAHIQVKKNKKRYEEKHRK